ncbi:substrate binding domain-containing protein, partial [Ramlibacter sp.]|uniref:substrate binding domain-containing protein n=1 Tax=Ramlibacter sp. TaxID=1917967 RepID=UPI0017F80836
AMVARRICSLPRGLYAAPDYLARAGRPAKPEALERHACIVGTGGARWLLARDGRQVEVAVRGSYSANNASMNRELALRGLGIAILPRRIVQAELRAGALRQVLAPWSVPPTEISAVTSTRLLPARTRAFLDFLTEALAETPGR